MTNLQTDVMNKLFVLLPVILLFSSCKVATTPSDIAQDKNAVNTQLDNWHEAAAKSDYDTYFDIMANDSNFIGTDATEHWHKDDFASFAKPYFDKGKGWSFTPIERHVYVSKDGTMAWFDELLNTWMKVCRGSGVMVKIDGKWKIKHYVLSMTVPNEVTNEVIPLKAVYENAILNEK